MYKRYGAEFRVISRCEINAPESRPPPRAAVIRSASAAQRRGQAPAASALAASAIAAFNTVQNDKHSHAQASHAGRDNRDGDGDGGRKAL